MSVAEFVDALWKGLCLGTLLAINFTLLRILGRMDR